MLYYESLKYQHEVTVLGFLADLILNEKTSGNEYKKEKTIFKYKKITICRGIFHLHSNHNFY